MPTAELASKSGTDLNGIASLANLFLGKDSKGSSSSTSQNSGGTTTTGTNTVSTGVSQDAIDAAVKSILEGSQGLAAVSSGQNKAGLYNSSTNRLLVNDLVARAAAQGASLNKTTTSTVNESTADNKSTTTNGNTTANVAPPIKPSAAIGGLGIMTALGQLSNTTAGKKVLESLGLSKGTGTAKINGINGPTNVSKSDVDAATDTAATTAVPNGSLASNNDQSVGSVGTSINNPSAYVAGDNNQDVGSVLTQSENGASGGTDLSFDQTAINGLDFGTDSAGGGDIGSGIGVDAAGGGPTDLGGDWGPDPSSVDFGDANTDFSDMFNFAEGGYVTPKGNHALIIKQTQSKQERSEKPGYAEGGVVDLTNLGLRTKGKTPDTGSSAVSGDQLVASILAKTARPAAAGVSGPAKLSTTGASNKGTKATNNASLFDNSNDNSEGNEGTGVSGTPSENAAAIGGFASSMAGLAFGPVGAAVANAAMDAAGQSHTSMDPVSNIVSTIAGMIGQDGMAAAAAAAAAGNTAPSASDDNAAVANGIAQDNDSDPLDALVGIVSDPDAAPSNDGTSAEGGGIGGSGNSAGDSNGGDGGNGTGGDGGGGDGSGGGSASAAKGGMIRGPGTTTSDSIDAKLSDGEYVIKAAVVDHYGKDFFDRLNQSISVAS